MFEAARTERRRGGIPVARYVVEPSVPQVAVYCLDHRTVEELTPDEHTHDFPMLVYFDRDGGTVRTGGRQRPIRAGDLYVIAPGDVMAVSAPTGIQHTRGWSVMFTAEALGPDQPATALSWRAHPLLFPFVRGTASGALRLRVPDAERATWDREARAIQTELRERREGYRQAALAHLTLLLVSVARLASDVVGDLRFNDERQLAEVFSVIERRYRESLSLRDVARAVSLTPGHLTTVVRRKTGRTVQEWITERRMTEARRLLVETDQSVSAISREVGYPDPSYFARSFRRSHHLTPRGWRQAAG